MNFNIEKTISEEAIAKDKSKIILSLEEDINNFLNHENYGKDIEIYTLKLNCVNPPKGFEHLFKLLPPKYIEFKSSKNIHTGEHQKFKNQFFCSINIIGNDYDEFIIGTNEQSKKILGKKILESLANLDKLPKKVKDFDKEKFKADMEKFFKEQSLL